MRATSPPGKAAGVALGPLLCAGCALLRPPLPP